MKLLRRFQELNLNLKKRVQVKRIQRILIFFFSFCVLFHSLSNGAIAKTVYFGKEIDTNLFDEMSKIKDLKKMIYFAESQNVTVYEIDGANKQLIPGAVFAEWKTLAEKEKLNQHPLYATFFRKDHFFKNYHPEKDLIVMNHSVTPSIFLHEFTHFLFQKKRFQSKEKYKSVETLTQEKNNASNAFFNLLSDQKSLNQEQINVSAVELERCMLESLKASSIEEVLVDVMVLEQIKVGAVVSDQQEIKMHHDHAVENIELSMKPLLSLQSLSKKLKISTKVVDTDLSELEALNKKINSF